MIKKVWNIITTIVVIWLFVSLYIFCATIVWYNPNGGIKW